MTAAAQTSLNAQPSSAPEYIASALFDVDTCLAWSRDDDAKRNRGVATPMTNRLQKASDVLNAVERVL